jgi:hypothetical protein
MQFQSWSRSIYCDRFAGGESSDVCGLQVCSAKTDIGGYRIGHRYVLRSIRCDAVESPLDLKPASTLRLQTTPRRGNCRIINQNRNPIAIGSADDVAAYERFFKQT